MLKIYTGIDSLDFRQLMDVYEQWNDSNGAAQYPDLDGNLRIIYAEQDFYHYLREFFSYDDAVYCLWEAEGRYKSALRLERYCDGLLLEALETAPQERRSGYAKQLIYSVITYARENGYKRIYSHISKENQVSLSLHLNCGFSIIADDALFIDNTYHSDYCTLLLNL